jgi:hypothetical protein
MSGRVGALARRPAIAWWLGAVSMVLALLGGVYGAFPRPAPVTVLYLPVAPVAPKAMPERDPATSVEPVLVPEPKARPKVRRARVVKSEPAPATERPVPQRRSCFLIFCRG